eukprot:757927-Pleurochrysis_carterae.AAC.1
MADALYASEDYSIHIPAKVPIWPAWLSIYPTIRYGERICWYVLWLSLWWPSLELARPPSPSCPSNDTAVTNYYGCHLPFGFEHTRREYTIFYAEQAKAHLSIP